MTAATTQAIDPTIFRAYDIRGIVGKTLRDEDVVLIGKAIGTLVRERGDNCLTIARDGRSSGERLLSCLCAGLLATGCDVIDLGMVPTPLLYFAIHYFEQGSGVMLTGSHNPAEYNGLKIVIQGKAMQERDIKSLYERTLSQAFAEGLGTRRTFYIVETYFKSICADVHLARPLHIVIDAGNGVAGAFAPFLFRQLGCEVHELFCEVDGRFPNHHPDPAQAENMQALARVVVEKKADVGLAFDGDGDRLGIVTDQGEVVCPDRLLMLFAQSLLATRPNAKIVFDVKCSSHLSDLVHGLGGVPIMWKTGHSYIKAKLAESGALLAGEMSGHFFFNDRWPGFDDAMYAGARFLEVLSQQERPCSRLFASIPNSINTPELKVLVVEEEKFDLMQKLIDCAPFVEAKELTTLDGLRVNFADGWGLIRPSNTTPYLILRFEAINQAVMSKIQGLFREWMLSVKPDWVLPF